MGIYRDREVWKGHYVIAVPRRGHIYFDDCAFSYANSEVIVLTHETNDGCGLHAGGIYVISRQYWDLLLEPHEESIDATKSRDHWNTLFTQYYEAGEDPTYNPVEPAAGQSYFPYHGTQSFTKLANSIFDHDAVIRMKLVCDPWRSSVTEAFERQSDWRKVLLDWAMTEFAYFVCLSHYEDGVD
jgi:hypothetical protein